MEQRWFIEGDIKACFDSIDHAILVTLISKKVKDARLVKLVYREIAGLTDKIDEKGDEIKELEQKLSLKIELVEFEKRRMKKFGS